jgi:hypothetical protein
VTSDPWLGQRQHLRDPIPLGPRLLMIAPGDHWRVWRSSRMSDNCREQDTSSTCPFHQPEQGSKKSQEASDWRNFGVDYFQDSLLCFYAHPCWCKRRGDAAAWLHPQAMPPAGKSFRSSIQKLFVYRGQHVVEVLIGCHVQGCQLGHEALASPQSLASLLPHMHAARLSM